MLTRAHRKRHRSFNNLIYSGTWTESWAHGFPHLKSETGGFTWPGNLMHILDWFGSMNSELCRPWVLLWCPARAGKLTHNLIYYWISYPVPTSRKPDQRIQATMELILECPLYREPSHCVLSNCFQPVAYGHLHPKTSSCYLAKKRPNKQAPAAHGHYQQTYTETQAELTNDEPSLPPKTDKILKEELDYSDFQIPT